MPSKPNLLFQPRNIHHLKPLSNKKPKKKLELQKITWIVIAFLFESSWLPAQIKQNTHEQPDLRLMNHDNQISQLNIAFSIALTNNQKKIFQDVSFILLGNQATDFSN